MRNDLPETCFATLPGTGDLIILKRGEKGYYRSDWETGDKTENQEIANHHNRRCGINPAQVEAMQIGSMCGFHVLGANPQIYFDEAQYIQSYEIGFKGTLKDPFRTICYPVEGNIYQYQVARGMVCYLEPSDVPKYMMGASGGFAFLMDMVQGKPLVPVTANWAQDGTCHLSLDHGSYTAHKEMNADYQIIAKVCVGPVEYALGELSGKFPSFVTWERTPVNDEGGTPNYYWEHYFESRDEAIRDFCARASEKYEMLAENHPPSHKPSIKSQLAAKAVPNNNALAKPPRQEER